MTKLCNKSPKLGCGRTLDISLFHKNGQYVQSYCKSCMETYRLVRKVQTESPAETARKMCRKLMEEVA